MSLGGICVFLQRIIYLCLVMKKVLFFAVIVFCTFTGVMAQDIVNLRMDRENMGLRGNVASMDEDQLLRKDYFRDDWPQRKWFVKDLRNVLREEDGRIVTFNPNGRMVTVSYTYQGKIGPKTQCSYTSNGLLTSFTGEGYKIEAQYKGNMADINVYAETKNYSKSVDIARANLKGAEFSYVYPFDLKCRQELTDDGLVLTSSYYYVDSMLARECEYNYNHNNLLTSEKTVDYTSGEKNVSITKYTYDNQSFLVKKEVNSKAVDATFTYENNDLGDCVKMTVERPYGTVVYTFDYQYDDQNNWTVRLEYEDGVFDNATLRSFTYHKDSGKAQKADKKVKDNKKDKGNVKDKDGKAAAKEAMAAEKKVAKEQADAEKAAKKETEAKQKAAAKAEKQRIAEEEKNMTKEERKAAQEARKAAEKERKSLEKAAAKEKAAADKATKEKAKAEKEKAKAAEKERKSLEKAAAKEKADTEKAAKKAAKEQEKAAKSKK